MSHNKKINYIVKRWKAITPKWDNNELIEFKQYLKDCSETKINEIYQRQLYFNSKQCEQFVTNEVNKLYKSKMFDFIKP